MKPSTLLAAVCAILLAVSATAAFNFNAMVDELAAGRLGSSANELAGKLGLSADELPRYLKFIQNHQPPVTERTLPRGTRKSKPDVDLKEKRKDGKDAVTCSVAWYAFCSSCDQSKSGYTDEKCSKPHKRFVKACFMERFRGVTRPQDFRIESLFKKYCPN